MSTLTESRTVTLPRVNLLPPEIEEQRRLKRVQAGLALAVVASLGVVGALYLSASQDVDSANDQLLASQARESQLQTQVTSYAEVPLVYGQVEAAHAQLEQAMGKEIRWSYFLNDLSLKIPSRVWLTKMTVTEQVDTAAVPGSALDTTTYLQTGIGNVDFEGNGYTHRDIAAWLESLAKQKGYQQPYFSKSTVDAIGDQKVVQFTSKVSLTEDALSQRYVAKAGN